MTVLVDEIIQRAYALNPVRLDVVLQSLGLAGWRQAVQGLSFQGWDTGGGCMMLIADLPQTDGYQVGITGGEADFPKDVENFWVGIMDPDGDEIFYMFVRNGQLQIDSPDRIDQINSI